MIEKLAPRIAERLALKFGQEAAEKWVGRLIPLASSVVGGVLNFSFVRTWGRRVQRNLRARHLAERSVHSYCRLPENSGQLSRHRTIKIANAYSEPKNHCPT